MRDAPFGIPTNFYMRTCLEGYDTFFFDKNILIERLRKNAGRLCRLEELNIIRTAVCPLCGGTYHGAPDALPGRTSRPSSAQTVDKAGRSGQIGVDIRRAGTGSSRRSTSPNACRVMYNSFLH
jgi:hypothetical protein